MNWKVHLISSLVLVVNTCLFAQGPPKMFEAPLSPRTANYTIQATLDTEAKTITAIEDILWRNPSQDTIHEMFFHMYLNAFSNTASSFIKEAGNRFLTGSITQRQPIQWGWVHCDSLFDAAGNEITENFVYVQPDDQNTDDKTVAKLTLRRPILPNDSIRLRMHFTSKMPEVLVRTGYSEDDFYLAVQWFPKLGVYEPVGTRGANKGRWNCRQFHAGGEFYADFGNYDVSVRLPKAFTVGASGLRYKTEEHDDGTKTVGYYVEDVIDFAWTASTNFVETNEQWQHVSIRVLNQTEHAHQADRYIAAAKETLNFFEERIGNYPYPCLTIVGPPFHASRTGAMEYPTLVTAMGLAYLPRGARLIETLTTHEIVHQFFMQMVATNEMEEPWMDEGITSYLEERIMDGWFGERAGEFNIASFRWGDAERSRAAYLDMKNPKVASSSILPWEFPNGEGHSINYFKSSTWLQTLEGLISREVMDEVLRAYFERWKFKHPGTQDFIDVVNEVVHEYCGDEFGPDMNWFFEQTLFGTDMCDYSVATIRNSYEGEKVGMEIARNGEQQFIPPSENRNPATIAEVIFHRNGELIFPQDIHLVFEDGSVVDTTWDGRARHFTLSFAGDTGIKTAIIDPHFKIKMDENYINNSLTSETDTRAAFKYSSKLYFWITQMFLTLGGFF